MASSSIQPAEPAFAEFDLTPLTDRLPPEDRSDGGSVELWGKDGFTFADFLDLINPLQHIPIISTIYRAITGDKIDPGARVIGGGIFGGPIGLVASAVNAVIAEVTGKDAGEHVVALFDSPDINPSPVMVAEVKAPRASEAGGQAAAMVPPAMPVALRQPPSTPPEPKPATGAIPMVAPERMPGAIPPPKTPPPQAVRDTAIPAAFAVPGQRPLMRGLRQSDIARGALGQVPTMAPAVAMARAREFGEARPAAVPNQPRPTGAPPAWLAAQMAAALDKYDKTKRDQDAPGAALDARE